MPRLTRRTALAAALAAFAAVLPARASHRVMTVEQARAAVQAGEMVLVDIRTPPEWAQSGIPDLAQPIDMKAPDFLDRIARLRQENPARAVGLICATGARSGYVATYLHDAGVDGIVNVAAGVHGRPDGWLARGLPVRPPK